MQVCLVGMKPHFSITCPEAGLSMKWPLIRDNRLVVSRIFSSIGLTGTLVQCIGIALAPRAQNQSVCFHHQSIWRLTASIFSAWEKRWKIRANSVPPGNFTAFPPFPPPPEPLPPLQVSACAVWPIKGFTAFTENQAIFLQCSLCLNRCFQENTDKQ